MIIFPTCVVVFAQGSEIDWNLPPVSWIVSIVFRRSRVDRASRSSFKTTIRIPGPNLVEHPLKFRPLPNPTGDFFPEDLLTPGFFQSLQLQFQLLILSRDTCVADLHLLQKFLH